MRIVCLANSFRMGGRCLGGVEVDQHNNPVLRNGRPRWVRPVCDTEYEEVPGDLVSQIALLDIIEFDPLEEKRHGHQTENILFHPDSIVVNGSLPLRVLSLISDNNRFSLVFGNRGAAVPEEQVSNFDFSLMLLELTEFGTNERIFENKTYPQIKLSFRHNGNLYNLPITDPIFLRRYNYNRAILEDKPRIFVTLSLATPNAGWSSKLAAGIILDYPEGVTETYIDENGWVF